ncbi:MAG TPA: DUF3127 domain-containing protein [Chitinophagaceae bacterium]|nr:DUF3127 domain-containing protein [Chitinophagaceae bacterium]
MASFETTGILKVKKDTQAVSDKFSKREFVITTDLSTQYPQYISMQLTQDKCALLDQFREGDEIKVSFNLRGREWSGPDGIRYFNSLEAWRLERASSSAPQPQSQASSSPISTVDVMPSQEIADDLPF